MDGCGKNRTPFSPKRHGSICYTLENRIGLQAQPLDSGLGLESEAMGGGGKRKVRLEHSAGGAVIQFRDSVPYVAMIATRRSTRWGLPKGAVAKGETSQQAALREVLEETGLIADILQPLDTIEYFFRAGDALIRKRVDFYLMLFVGGTLTPQLSEVDDAQWFPLSVAVEKASFDSERKLLEDALSQVDSLVQRISASSSS